MTKVVYIKLRGLKRSHIRPTGSNASPKGYAVALSKFYPNIKLSDTVTIIYFKVAE